MIPDVLYYKAVRNKHLLVDRKGPITAQEIPGILFQPARGKFPALEEALKQGGVSIPESWAVENLLAATCAGTAVMLREDLKLSALTPQEVISDPLKHQASVMLNLFQHLSERS